MVESLPPYVDSKTVSVAGTPEALTARILNVKSVALVPQSGNTGIIYIVDNATPANKWPIPVSGVVLPINELRVIFLDVDTNDDGLDWVAV